VSLLAKEHIPRFVSESRLAQGLPERVADPAVLSKVVVLLRSALGKRDSGGVSEQADAAATS